MIRWLSIFIALVAFVGSAVRLYAAESETFRGTAARSGTYKRPLLDVDGKRYELKASDKADAAVAEALDKFSNVFVPHRPKGRTARVAGTAGHRPDGDEHARICWRCRCGISPCGLVIRRTGM